VPELVPEPAPQRKPAPQPEPGFADSVPYDQVPYDDAPYDPVPYDEVPYDAYDAYDAYSAPAHAPLPDTSTNAPSGSASDEDPAAVQALLQASFGASVVLSETDE
jgi:hypothetical protein